MPTLDVLGGPLAYDEAGSGPPITLIHAGIADRRMWAPVTELLAPDFRVVRYDLRGYGDSQPVPATFAHYDDFAAVLDALGVERTAVVAGSFGGRVAIDAALAHPDRVSALILLGSVVSGYRMTEFDAVWERVIGDIDEDDLTVVADAEVRLWVVGPDRRPEDVDGTVLALAGEMSRIALAGETALDEAVEAGRVTVRNLDPPALGRLGEVTAPTMVTTGEYDLPEIIALADRIAAEIPGAVRVPDLTDTAHLPALERPAEVAALIRNALT